MMHLRIVAPKRCSAEVLATLERNPAVVNIITLPGAARKPEGDVILCDVPREAASIVVADLKQLGLSEDGSIAMERVDVEIAAVARRAEIAAPGAPSTAVVWEEVEELTSESTSLTTGFLAFMVLATIIAAVGILLDSPILIIGAMVLGPEFGPIAAFCVALVQRHSNLALRSALALAVGFPAAIAAAYLATLAFKWTNVAPDVFTESDHGFADLISNPDAYTIVVAFCAGIAGMLSLTTAKSGSLIGVLISVTTIPAAANIGVAAAYSDWASWRGSLLQLGLNLLAICVAGVLTLLVQRHVYSRRQAAHLRA